MTYVVTGIAHPIAIVGDSLFAGSMGGGNVSYRDALQNNLEKILTLPDETIICPRTRPDEHSRRGETAQPVLCCKVSGLNFATDQRGFFRMNRLICVHPCASVANFST